MPTDKQYLIKYREIRPPASKSIAVYASSRNMAIKKFRLGRASSPSKVELISCDDLECQQERMEL